MAGNNFSSLNKTVRAVIIHGKKVLVCREKNGKWHALPGWSVGKGQKSEEILASGIRERLATAIDECKYIGAISNLYQIDKFKKHQAFDLIYSVKIESFFEYAESGNLEFIWLEIEAIKRKKIYPELLQEKLVQWFDNQQVFWGSN